MIFIWIAVVVIVTVLIPAAITYFSDPAGIYHGGKRARLSANTRLRKLQLLKVVTRYRQINTLVLGSSRITNLDIAATGAFPGGVFNFSVSSAAAEDFLASYMLFKGIQATSPQVVVIVAEPPVFHPSMACDWEALVGAGYSEMLASIGAVDRSRGWQWRLLWHPSHIRESLSRWQELSRRRAGRARHKFRWHGDGSGEWLDVPEGSRREDLIIRQLKHYPRTGLGIASYTALGENRCRWFTELLAECARDGVHVVAAIPPEHPRLTAHIDKLGGADIYASVAAFMEQATRDVGGVLCDLHLAECLQLSDNDFRDVMHMTTTGSDRLADKLARIYTEHYQP